MKLKELKKIMGDNLLFEENFNSTISVIEFGDTIFDEPVDYIAIEMSDKENLTIKFASKNVNKHTKKNTSNMLINLLNKSDENKNIRILKLTDENELVEAELKFHNVELSERLYSLELVEK